jgi:hypothetical protein
MGGSGDDDGDDVAVDARGNTYITGTFSTNADFAGRPLTARGRTDIFLASFDAAGGLRWAKSFGGSEKDVADGIAIDREGNILLIGRFGGSAEFGAGNVVAAGSHDAFVASYSPSGELRWHTSFGDVGQAASSSGIAVAARGDVCVTGSFGSSVVIGGIRATSLGDSDAFVVCLSTLGELRWFKTFGGPSADEGNEIAIDSEGNIYVSGEFSATAGFGASMQITSKGGRDVFLTSFDASGQHRWQKTFGGSNDDEADTVATDAAGNVYLNGSFSGVASFDDGTHLVAKGESDVFVASFDGSGKHRWQRVLGGASADGSYGMALAPSGESVLTGRFRGQATFGGNDVLVSAGGYDAFVASFDSEGRHLGQWRFGGTGDEKGDGVSVDPRWGRVFVVGRFTGQTKIAGSSFLSQGRSDIFFLGGL